MSKPLKINIAKPCSENWEQMPLESKGRFCANCKKTIVDFSNLSDSEVYNYFSANNASTCGRFHKDQLSHDIIPLKKHSLIWDKVIKPFAAGLALLNLTYSEAAVNKKKYPTAIHPAHPKKSKNSTGEQIKISGIVKDQHNELLEGAEIKFGDNVTTKTDKEGKFEIEIANTEDIKPTLIAFSYPDRVTTVRNYHPAMLSTSYDITLYHSNSGDPQFIMGGIGPDTLKFLPASFELKGSELNTREYMSFVATLANELRNHPSSNINIVAFKGEKNVKNQSMYLQNRLLTRLVEWEGIAVERLKPVTEKGNPQKQKTIEVRNCTH